MLPVCVFCVRCVAIIVIIFVYLFVVALWSGLSLLPTAHYRSEQMY